MTGSGPLTDTPAVVLPTSTNCSLFKTSLGEGLSGFTCLLCPQKGSERFPLHCSLSSSSALHVSHTYTFELLKLRTERTDLDGEQCRPEQGGGQCALARMSHEATQSHSRGSCQQLRANTQQSSQHPARIGQATARAKAHGVCVSKVSALYSFASSGGDLINQPVSGL